MEGLRKDPLDYKNTLVLRLMMLVGIYIFHAGTFFHFMARLRTHMCRSLLLPIWIRAGIQSDQQEGIHAHIPSEKSSGPSAAILDRHDFMRRDDRHRIPVLGHSS